MITNRHKSAALAVAAFGFVAVCGSRASAGEAVGCLSWLAPSIIEVAYNAGFHSNQDKHRAEDVTDIADLGRANG